MAGEALNAIHREFFETAPATTVNLYIAGTGAVGSALTELIRESSDHIAHRSGKVLRIEGYSNKRDFAQMVRKSAPRGMLRTARISGANTKGFFAKASAS